MDKRKYHVLFVEVNVTVYHVSSDIFEVFENTVSVTAVSLCVVVQAESSLSRQASESRGAESEPSTLTQGDTSTSAAQEAADAPQAEQVGVKVSLWG